MVMQLQPRSQPFWCSWALPVSIHNAAGPFVKCDSTAPASTNGFRMVAGVCPRNQAFAIFQRRKLESVALTSWGLVFESVSCRLASLC